MCIPSTSTSRDAQGRFQWGEVENQTPALQQKTSSPESQRRGESQAGHKVQYQITNAKIKHYVIIEQQTARQNQETPIKLGLVFAQFLLQQPQLTPVRAALIDSHAAKHPAFRTIPTSPKARQSSCQRHGSLHRHRPRSSATPRSATQVKEIMIKQ